MRTAILIGTLLVTAGLGLLAADPVAAAPVDCSYDVQDEYVTAGCTHPKGGSCVIVNLDDGTRHCTP